MIFSLWKCLLTYILTKSWALYLMICFMKCINSIFFGVGCLVVMLIVVMGTCYIWLRDWILCGRSIWFGGSVLIAELSLFLGNNLLALFFFIFYSYGLYINMLYRSMHHQSYSKNLRPFSLAFFSYISYYLCFIIW